MRKLGSGVVALVLFVCIAGGLLCYRLSTPVEAENLTCSHITVENETPYELTDIMTQFNGNEIVKTKKLGVQEKAEIEVPDGTDYVTRIRIKGKTVEGKSFYSSYSGLASDDSVIKVYMDEDATLGTQSNIVSEGD